MVTGGTNAVHPSPDDGEDGCDLDGVPVAKPEVELASYIRQSITGGAKTFQGPFGRKQLVPCDALYRDWRLLENPETSLIISCKVKSSFSTPLKRK